MMATGTSSSAPAIAKSRMRSCPSRRWNHHAIMSGIAIFMISLVWIVLTPMLSQRVRHDRARLYGRHADAEPARGALARDADPRQRGRDDQHQTDRVEGDRELLQLLRRDLRGGGRHAQRPRTLVRCV